MCLRTLVRPRVHGWLPGYGLLIYGRLQLLHDVLRLPPLLLQLDAWRRLLVGVLQMLRAERGLLRLLLLRRDGRTAADETCRRVCCWYSAEPGEGCGVSAVTCCESSSCCGTSSPHDSCCCCRLGKEGEASPCPASSSAESLGSEPSELR